VTCAATEPTRRSAAAQSFPPAEAARDLTLPAAVAKNPRMHPILFEIPVPWGAGHQPVYAYGVMLGISLLLGWQIVMRLGSRAGLPTALLGDVYISAAIAGVVGARLLYVLTNLETFDSPSQWLDIRSGGLVAYGGFLAGFAAAFLHLRAKRVSLFAFADPAAPAIACGLFFTRIGCYLYGCDFGARLSEGAPAWLAKLGTFPQWREIGLRGSPAYLHHVNAYGLDRAAAAAFPVHPTQLYEAVLGLVLFGVSWRVFSRRAFQGQALLVLTLVYAGARFVLEYLRDDPERGELYGFSTSQLISLLLLPLCGVAYSMLAKRAREAAVRA
jgi:phosphatidylglycerol---prolipoprotein diacylglyceryl transferase